MKTIYLDRNESQYGPPEACFDILRNVTVEQLTQYTRDFNRGVKSRVSERLAAWLGLPEKNILLGYGTETLLKMAVHRYLKDGQTLMVPNISWWYYSAIAAEVQAHACTYRVFAEGDAYHYRQEELMRVYDDYKPRVVFIATPNNPTGNRMPLDMLRKILAHFKESVVVVDEAYWGYASLDSAYVKELISEFDNVMVFRSFSKYYALAGVRMGYAMVSDRFRDFANFTTLYLGYNQVNESVVLAALDHPEHYQTIARKMDEDKKMYYKELGAHRQITCYQSDANFLLIKLHHEMVEPLKKRLDSAGLKVKFFTEPLLLNHIRLSLGTQEQNRMVLDNILIVSNEMKGNYAELVR